MSTKCPNGCHHMSTRCVPVGVRCIRHYIIRCSECGLEGPSGVDPHDAWDCWREMVKGMKE